MINNKENQLKLYRLKKIYGILDSLTQTKKPERLNSAVNSPTKIKFPSYQRIRIKKLHLIDKKKDIDEKKLNMNKYIMDIVKRKNIKRRVLMKGNFSTNVVNSSSFNINYNGKKNEIIQTDKFHNHNIKSNRNPIFPKEFKCNNACRSIMEYRIKKYHQKPRNIKDETKSNLPIYKTTKNVHFPKIYNHNSETKVQDYLDVSNIQKSKRNINIKKYYCVLNNLRIKLHGNIFITRKSKEKESIKYYKDKMKINKLKNNLKVNSNISMDKSYKYTNISKYEQMCNFSNQMIRDSLSEKHMKNIFKNLNK
jgi:hypothetical protein